MNKIHVLFLSNGKAKLHLRTDKFSSIHFTNFIIAQSSDLKIKETENQSDIEFPTSAPHLSFGPWPSPIWIKITKEKQQYNLIKLVQYLKEVKIELIHQSIDFGNLGLVNYLSRKLDVPILIELKDLTKENCDAIREKMKKVRGFVNFKPNSDVSNVSEAIIYEKDLKSINIFNLPLIDVYNSVIFDIK